MSLKSDYYDAESFARHWKARQEALAVEKRREEDEERMAKAIVSAGLTLIPSEVLRDNEIVVSRRIYEATKRVLND